MSTAAIVKPLLELQAYVVKMYVDDLSDADLLVRPVPGANHIAWQIGHLIEAEHKMVEAACPGSMPPLPQDLVERHKPEKASSDSRADFLSKAEYLRIMDEQRAGTLAALDRLSEEELEKPSPEKYRMFAPNVGGVIGGQITHWMMHAGQWAIVRRKLGKPPLF